MALSVVEKMALDCQLLQEKVQKLVIYHPFFRVLLLSVQ